MKRCPTCQKTFDDDKRFCQIDGTPLVADAPAQSEPVDPYKTVVGGQFPAPPPASSPADDSMKTMVVDSKSKDEDILQIPEVFDPMKTVVASDIKKEVPPIKEPEPPKFNEPSLSPPSFGDLSSYSQNKETPKSNEPPKQAPPIANNEPSFGSPFSQTPNEAPKFDSPFAKEEEKPKNDPFPPYKDPTTPLGEKKDPFQNSAFGLPQTPLDQSYTPPTPAFNPPPAASQQNDWSPPPAPVAGWENQEIGQNTPFNPPVAGTEGENKTLAIISLVLAVISIPCCGAVVFGVAAAVTGFLAKKKADENPREYGGRGLALAGMIIGGITAVLGLILTVLQLLFGVLGSMSR